MIRPLLIVLMSFAHFGLLDHTFIIRNSAPLAFHDWMIVFLKAGLAKSGVPLLSLISGYLAVLSLERYGYPKLLLRKAKRLVWPLIWSNLLFIVLVLYPLQEQAAEVRPDLEIYPFNLAGWLQATFAYYKVPANMPLYFLKDLFTCFLLLPLLVLAARVKYLNLAVLAWMAYKCIYLKSAFLFEVYPLWFMRFDIVFAFYFGILLFYWNRQLLIENAKLNGALIALFLAATGLASVSYVVLAKPEHLELYLWTDFLVKVFSVLGCVAIMSLLVTRSGRLSRLLEWLSPYAYTLFLTHLFSFTFFTDIYLKIVPEPNFFGLSGTLYLVLMVMTAVLVSIGLKRLWSGLAARVPTRV